MGDEEKKYYVYDKKEKRFITSDGGLAEVGESFKNEMLSMKTTYMVFVDKLDYHKQNGGMLLFEAMGERGD